MTTKPMNRWLVPASLPIPIFVHILAGYWMNEIFPAYGGFAEYAAMLIFGMAMVGSVLITLWRMRWHDMTRHCAWAAAR